MIKVAHIYASQAKFNSGDFMLGIATKKYFKEKYLNNQKCQFHDIDCRDPKNFSDNNVKKLNNFDYILVGGGGLILPDSAPNKTSCWQWNIPKSSYDKINKPIYVVSIGYNCFFGQNMSMPTRENNTSDKTRIPIFSENIKKLIDKSEHFSMRHKGDINSLVSVIGEEYRDKIKFEFCPSIPYVGEVWKPKLNPNNKKFIAIEIKDDREWRRYHKIGKLKFYNHLTAFVKHCKENKIPVCYMSHDGSKNFYKHLISRGVKIPLLDNSSGVESRIMENYSKVKILFCSAGHSQMMAHGLGIDTISLVSHPKLKYFCEDTNNDKLIDINEEESVVNKMKTFI